MAAQQQSTGKVRVSVQQAIGLLGPYVKNRGLEQIKALGVIIPCMILFQTLVLGIAIADAAIISAGLALVIIGLAFFMEGLLLGLMPLGETIGVKLPQKAKLPLILLFSLILGYGVTLAEPAIGALKAAGSSVKPWDAPLLFILLNKYSNYLVYAVGTGVGLAVLSGMLRFLYNWSLKPFLFVGFGLALGISIWAFFDPNWGYLTGVAWDCGGITTGPVTVPLVLALGIGICRVVGTAESGLAGFGVVSLASLYPIITVMLLGLGFLGKVPAPMTEADFYQPENRQKVESMFTGPEDYIGYALRNAAEPNQLKVFQNNRDTMLGYIKNLASQPELCIAVFGGNPNVLQRWAALQGSPGQGLAVFGSMPELKKMRQFYSKQLSEPLRVGDVLQRNALMAAQAIVPLVLFLLLVLLLFLREKLPRSDEMALGVVFAILGMCMFSIGMELGLGKIGGQVGEKLPSSFKAIPLPQKQQTIDGFSPVLVQTAVTPSGEKQPFFHTMLDNQYIHLPYQAQNFDSVSQQYTYIPFRGPLFQAFGGLVGIFVVLLFAFLMGYSATLAEPALNALGLKVEELSVGTVKKFVLIQAVALGVGIGMAFGVAKIIWDIPLLYLLIPPYIVLLTLTVFSTEEFVNIGWDSGGVTTGPVTVPLVISMGLGISGQVGVVEGFGILALASVYPCLCVVAVGLYFSRRRRTAAREADAVLETGGAS
jgi:hypothetical protein